MTSVTFKNISNRKKILLSVLTVLGIPAALTYGKWEVLTLLHGKEFHNNTAVDNAVGKTGAMVLPPKFIKIVNYSNDEAEVLWVVEGERGKEVRMESGKKDHHNLLTFRKGKMESGQIGWVVETWANCTPANGSPTCHFPFYGGIPEEW
jgi:hypothetical protein